MDDVHWPKLFSMKSTKFYAFATLMLYSHTRWPLLPSIQSGLKTRFSDESQIDDALILCQSSRSAGAKLNQNLSSLIN